jgi:hypothetical protein
VFLLAKATVVLALDRPGQLGRSQSGLSLVMEKVVVPAGFDLVDLVLVRVGKTDIGRE